MEKMGSDSAFFSGARFQGEGWGLFKRVAKESIYTKVDYYVYLVSSAE